MAEEKSFGDETRQGSLINRWGVLVHDSAHLDKGVDKLWRCDQKTEAQRWVKDLAHSAGINHPAGVVQTLKTWQRRPIETKLGIIIILQDVAVAHSANSIRAFRRFRLIVTPRGNWCDGATRMSLGEFCREHFAINSPSRSIGRGTILAPTKAKTLRA